MGEEELRLQRALEQENPVLQKLKSRNFLGFKTFLNDML